MEPTNEAASAIESTTTPPTTASSNTRRKAWFALGTILFGTINIISAGVMYFILDIEMELSNFGETSLLMLVIIASGVALVYRGGISLVIAAGAFAYMWIKYLQQWMFG